MPKGKTIIHSTLDPNHLNKDVEATIGLVGDAGLVLDALLEEIGKTVTSDRNASAVAEEIAASHKEWLAKWMPKLTHNDAPLNPYRVLWDLQHTVDIKNTIITHDAGSPRDQISPFWEPIEPLTYIGWGKTTQLGYGLGLAMGAKLARPDKLCINVWGDAAIGFTGMDFETAVRERIPILSVLLNNFSMAIELGEAFTKETGHTLTIASDTGGGLKRKVEAGEKADVLIAPDAVMDALAKSNHVVAGTRADIAKTAIGVAVRAGAPQPDISTVDAFKRALLEARSIVYNDPAIGATSGIHFAAVLERLGIAEAVKPKTVLWKGGYAAEALLNGQAELCVHQISEILPVKGGVLVGPLPAEVSEVTVYAGAMLTSSPSPDAGRAFRTS